MPYLAVAVALLGSVAGLNLLLTYGVVRRLREHTRRLDALSSGQAGSAELMREVGSQPGDFEAVTTDGESLTRQTLAVAGEAPDDHTLVAFLSPSCSPCLEQMPRFAERAAILGRDRALAVLVGPPDATREMVAQLEPVARVVTEVDRGRVQQAFDVRGYPAICLLDGEGRISATSWTVDQLPEAMPA